MVINWNENVNTRVLRSGTTWSDVIGFIEDESLSGKKKRRLAHSLGKRQISVKMRFTLEEYEYFQYWWINECKKGCYSFYFPAIDSMNTTRNRVMKVYRFAKNGAPRYNNPSGDMVDCTMGWEEV